MSRGCAPVPPLGQDVVVVRLHTRGDLDRHGHGYGSLSFLTFLSLGDESSPPPECGDQVNSLGCGSAEGEHKGLYARSEKLDLEQAISNGFGLSDQLIQPLVGNRTVALVVNVTSMSRARCLSIEEHAKA